MQNFITLTHKWRCGATALAIITTAVIGLQTEAGCDNQYATFRCDAQRSGRSALEITYNPTVAWTMSANTGSAPVIGQDGTFYYGAYDNYFYARAGNGSVKWKYLTETPACGTASLAMDGSSIYFGVTGKIMALNVNGETKWVVPFRFATSATPTPIVTDKNGTLYFGTDDNYIYAVDPNGGQKWAFKAGGSIRQSVALSPDGSTIYATCGDGRVYAINAESGSMKWKTDIISPTYNCAVADDGTVYVGSSSGKFYAIGADGKTKWMFNKAQSKITCAAAIGRDGSVYFGSADMNLYAVDAAGQLKWVRRTGGPIYTAPVIDSEGTILIGAWPAELQALNPTNGGMVWTRTVPGAPGIGLYSSPVLGSEGGLGSLYVLDLNSKDFTSHLTKYTGPVQYIEPVHPEPSSLFILASLTALMGVRGIRRRNKD